MMVDAYKISKLTDGLSAFSEDPMYDELDLLVEIDRIQLYDIVFKNVALLIINSFNSKDSNYYGC